MYKANILGTSFTKKLLALFVVLGLLLTLSPFGNSKASAAEPSTLPPSEGIVSAPISEEGSTLTITPQSTVIDNKSIEVDITGKLGMITGSFKYKSKVGPVTFVSLTMTLQYRENFLDSWEGVSTKSFVYAGGQGLIEENEANFPAYNTGTYRIVMNGTVTGTEGFSMVSNRASASKKFEGGIITSSEPVHEEE